MLYYLTYTTDFWFKDVHSDVRLLLHHHQLYCNATHDTYTHIYDTRTPIYPLPSIWTHHSRLLLLHLRAAMESDSRSLFPPLLAFVVSFLLCFSFVRSVIYFEKKGTSTFDIASEENMVQTLSMPRSLAVSPVRPR